MLNLRRARLDDHWRTAFKRNYAASIEGAQYSKGILFDGMEIVFKRGINAFVGRNGIGKSNLMRSLYNSFVTEESNRERFHTPLLESGEIEIILNVDRKSVSKVFLQDSAPEKSDEKYPNTIGFMYDPCTLIPSVQHLFVQQDNLEELLESFSGVVATSEDLKLINFLTNGEYRSVTTFSLEDEFESFPRIPFFRVATRDTAYDSRSMGLGELSLFYFYWLSSYMNKIEGNRILFIEEPESFLPPSTQERLADVLAMIAAEEGVAIVMSSHSEHILRRLPRTHIHVLKKTLEGIRCLAAADNNEPLKLLGITSAKQGVILFEDTVAETFIKSLLRMSLRLSPDSFYYHKSGSDGALLKDLQRLPPMIESFRFIGIFDGDCNGKYVENLKNITNYCYLPDTLPPEEVLLEYLTDADERATAKGLGITETELIEAKASAAGSDHHDYFHVFSKSINREFKETVSKICELWILDAGNSDKVSSFLTAIESFFNEP